MIKYNSNSLMIVFALVVSVAFFQGCTTDKAFVKKDITTLPPLKVFRYDTPEFTKVTLGGAAAGVCLAGGLGAYGIAASRGKELREKTALPDFGELVIKEFAERVSKEIPNWPAMTIEDQPVAKDYTYVSGTSLEFKVNSLGLHSLYGFLSSTSANMKDANGNVLWRKSFNYRSSKFDRSRSIEEFEASNAIFLKEEMQFAAKKTISDFIEHFKGGKK